MASEIGALCDIFRDIDVLVLSARRPSLAAPPRGPQVGRTFIATIPHQRHIFLRNLVLTFFRCHRSKYWLPTSAGPLCGLVAVPFVLLVVRSGPAPYQAVKITLLEQLLPTRFLPTRFLRSIRHLGRQRVRPVSVDML